MVCFDEAFKPLFGEARPAQRRRLGAPARVDYEYERKGVCHPMYKVRTVAGLAFLYFGGRLRPDRKIP